MFAGLSYEICAAAWNVIIPSAIAANIDGVTNKQAGTIVVLYPHTGDVAFMSRLNYNHPDAEKYDRIAVAKAVVSKKTGLPSRQVQQEAPHLYLPGMTKWGGAVIRNGLVVAFSGVQAVYDEAIAWFTDMLGFTLVADDYQPEQDKRWVLVAPPGAPADTDAVRLLVQQVLDRLSRTIGLAIGKASDAAIAA